MESPAVFMLSRYDEELFDRFGFVGCVERLWQREEYNV